MTPALPRLPLCLAGRCGCRSRAGCMSSRTSARGDAAVHRRGGDLAVARDRRDEDQPLYDLHPDAGPGLAGALDRHLDRQGDGLAIAVDQPCSTRRIGGRPATRLPITSVTLDTSVQLIRSTEVAAEFVRQRAVNFRLEGFIERETLTEVRLRWRCCNWFGRPAPPTRTVSSPARSRSRRTSRKARKVVRLSAASAPMRLRPMSLAVRSPLKNTGFRRLERHHRGTAQPR